MTPVCPSSNSAANKADGPTDQAGVTTFTKFYYGGGWKIFPTYVWLLGDGGWARIEDPLEVSYNSPDINANLVVNLSDVPIFARAYGKTCPGVGPGGN